MPSKPVVSLKVDVYAGTLTELGYDRLADALNDADLVNRVQEFVYDTIHEGLPPGEDGISHYLEWFTVTVREEREDNV